MYQHAVVAAASCFNHVTSMVLSLVETLHEWFDSQLADHGKDAVEGHHHGYMKKP